MTLNKWDHRFLALAKEVASWSKDTSTKVGCVIVDPDSRAIVSVGYNGLPRSVNDDIPERFMRPVKYLWTEHSERNAIFNAALRGTSTKACTMYMPWFPCADCGRAIVQSGISRLVCGRPNFSTRPDWAESMRVALTIMREGGVTLDYHPQIGFCSVCGFTAQSNMPCEVCVARKAHATDCAYLTALQCMISVPCDVHGEDVCDECDGCTCSHGESEGCGETEHIVGEK